MEFLNLLSSLLKNVLIGDAKYLELQKFVDNAVIEDELPDDLPNELLQQIFELQTDLELIAEHQSTYAGSRLMFEQKDIAAKLNKYVERLSVG
jgi:hypothetical protein